MSEGQHDHGFVAAQSCVVDFGLKVPNVQQRPLTFDVELHTPMPELADPLARVAILPVIADVEILADPSAVEAIDELHVARAQSE